MVPQKAGIAGTVSQQAVKLQEYKARRNKNIMDPRGVVIFVWLMTSPWCCAGQRAARKTNDANKLSIVPPGYLQELAPWPQDGSPLMINFSLKVNAIMETDEKQTAVILDSFFRVKWSDWRLNYPEEEESGKGSGGGSDNGEVRHTIVNPVLLEEVWLPDPYIFNVRDISTVRLLLKDVRGVVLYSDGTLFVSILTKIHLGCSAKFSRFPFDEQECSLAIYSFFLWYGLPLHLVTALPDMYEAPTLEMRWLPSGLVVDPRVKDQLTNFDYTFTIGNTSSNTCPCYKCIPPEAPCVYATLVLTRKVLGHLLSTFLPSGLFVAVSYASLFWPADVIPGRTVLVITSLLTLVSMHTGVRQSSPETSYIKAVDVWMIACIVMSALMLFEYGIVLFIKKQHKEPAPAVKEEPPSRTAHVPPSAKSIKTAFELSVGREKVSPLQVNLKTRQSAHRWWQALKEDKVENIFKVLAPVVFLFFNLVYWPYYLVY
ncbi:glycine receptor subunit alpha-2-like [Portunus trituberculatus]|uniref:glycine receptor subunit alpha-2-like n=1 Tax=Portunus trituberculatus TaxID=210409 RepID=UPI001E1CD13D|nr:glycine receptor subunit alpha-2-like [Portunus trituberculatus]